MEAHKTHVSVVAELFPLQGEWTETYYFALPETNRIVELSNGELLVSPSPSRPHQKITARLYRLVDDYATAQTLGETLIAPFDVRLQPNQIRQPDVLFIRTDNLSRIRDDRYLDGPPDWVAEVISPGSRETDEVVKLAEYAKAGVPEYWLLDPQNKTIRVYTLDDEQYMLALTATATQIAKSVVLPGLEVAAKAVFVEV